ncbi:MAG TPA: hypothetical protein PL137_07055, partial [Nocardioides sp.]|nr:hypothetical protein [Nocardioides sp.]
LLPDREQEVFRRLSVLAGGFTVADAEAISGDPRAIDALESLLDKSLVRRLTDDAPGARFALLVSLREYAAERLTEADEVAATRDRHAAWFADRSQRWEATLGSAAETATLEELPRARADLRA